MLLLDNQLENVAIMSLQSGSKLGTAVSPVVDPRKLQVTAYHVSGPHIHEASVLYTSDIREVGPLGFIVDSADSIMVLDDSLVRLQEVIGFNFHLLGKLVVDDHKKKLGKVAEYSVESSGFYVQKLHVSQSVIKNFTSTNLIIHRSQITEVTDQHIVVRSATIPQTTGLAQALNPFRKPSPQLKPESTQPKQT